MSRSLRLALALALLPVLSREVPAQVDPGGRTPNLEKDTRAPAEDAAGDWTRPVPPGLQVGSFASMLAGRVSSDGVIDSGAGLLDLVDGRTGQAVVPERIAYGRGPTLSVVYASELAGLHLDVVVAAAEAGTKDQRIVVAEQVRVANRSAETVAAELVFRLRPGDVTDPFARPAGALPFLAPPLEVAPTFVAEEGGLVSRDGQIVLGWTGVEPAVRVVDRVDGPDDVAATYTYEVVLPPGGVTYVEVKLAGPPQQGERDEERFRRAFGRRSVADIEEVLGWQWQYRGGFSNLVAADDSLRRTLVGSMQQLRLFGLTHYQTKVLSDRSYGHPPRDAAVEAEILGVFLMYNLEEIVTEHVPRLLGRLEDDLAALSPERRVAHLYGLVQGLRLAPALAGHEVLAQAIVDHVESVPVRPWLDPEVVHADLVDYVTTYGLDASGIPPLEWADLPDDGSTASLVLACRRSVSAGDAQAAWEKYRQLMDRGCVRGMGAWEQGGELDGRYSLATLNLAREMLVDDHHGDLIVGACVPRELVVPRSDLSFYWMPTRFGLTRGQIFFASRKIMGTWVQHTPTSAADRILVRFPPGVRPRRLFGKAVGGEAQVLDDGTVRLWIDRGSAAGVRTSVSVGDLSALYGREFAEIFGRAAEDDAGAEGEDG